MVTPSTRSSDSSPEAFYIIEGTINVQVGDDVVHGTPGTFVLIPRGTVHTFWNVGPSPAKLLVIVSPPGMEEYLAEVVGDHGYTHLRREGHRGGRQVPDDDRRTTTALIAGNVHSGYIRREISAHLDGQDPADG